MNVFSALFDALYSTIEPIDCTCFLCACGERPAYTCVSSATSCEWK